MISKLKFPCNQTRKIHLLHDKAFINNQWVSANSNKTFEVTSPATGEVIGCVPDMDTSDLQKAIQAAYDAFPPWKDTTSKHRSHLLRKWYDCMEQNKDHLCKIIRLEAGKPLKESEAEVNYGNSFVEFFSAEATRMHGKIFRSPDKNKKILIERQPIGVVGLITPWNFPYALIARKAAAALAAACTCVIKPAEDTPLSALALMELAERAGFPPGVVNAVTSSRANAPDIGNLLCRSPLVAGISFTGSTKIGKLLYKECSFGIKRIGLELGGDAPFIVYKSADLDKAIRAAMNSKFRNSGQTCVSSNRFFIHCEKYDAFVEKLLQQIRCLKMGDLEDPDVSLGPLIHQDHLNKVSGLVKDAVSKGASVLTGGKPAPQFGPLCYEPTVLADVTEDMQIYKEEVFGPVVNLMKFSEEEDSIRMANATETGLAGYIFSEDVAQIFRVTRKLEVGMCGVNEGLMSMAEAPFGGIKESGVGREGSSYGLEDFTYVKYVCIGGLQNI